ncbi:MAG: efflux RND transporter periplasmic adaptor subunit [Phycisphaerales bacterium]
MSTTQNSPHSATLPKRALMPVLIPLAVLCSTAALIAWSAWPVLRPSRTIEFTQAVFVQSDRDLNQQRLDENAKSTELAIRSTRTVQAAGWLEAEPFYTAATALADGVVAEMLVLEGDFVEEGQVLARLVDDDSKLRVARSRAELLRSKAAVSQTKSLLVAAEQNWESPYELERAVSSQTAMLKERVAELEQLPSLIAEQQSLATKADEELKSVERAYKGNAAAEIEFITARELASAQHAKLESIQARGEILRASIERIRSDLHAAQQGLKLRIDDRARLDGARAAYELAQAEVAQREAQLAEAELELARMTIHAPITGYVQRRFKVPGDKVVRMMDSSHSAHIVHLYDPSKLQVRVDVPLADASQIRVGQECEVIVEVLAEQAFKGEVLRITHEADLQKNTLQIKVRVIDPDPILRPEMLTRVKFLGQNEQATTTSPGSSHEQASVRIPSNAIDRSQGQEQVWIIHDRANGRGVLRSIPVTLVGEQGEWATIRGDLQPGSMLAADPEGCRSGQVVNLESVNGGAS